MIDLSTLNAQGSGLGAISVQDADGLRKALEAGYGTDVAALTGGAAVRVQSLDTTLQATIASNQNFALFNKLPKPGATATVDEWMELSSQGGFAGGSFNSEVGNISGGQGTYNRRVGLVKYLMTKCELSFVAVTQGNHIPLEAQENTNGTLRLLIDAESACFEGDSDVVSEEFDGIYKQMVDLNSADHIIDAEANSLTSINAVAQAAAVVSGIDNFGVPTDLLCSPLTGADLDVNLDPAYRVALTSGVMSQRGTPVRGIVTAQGDISLTRDIFIRDEPKQVPFELLYSSVASANAYSCASVPTGVAASDTASKFAAGHAGNYYYAVAGITKAGQSVVSKSAQIAVAAGDKVTLTITASSAGTETGYVIYRSRMNGTNATNDFRYVAKVAKDGATTTWVDYNREIPGTTRAYMLNLSPSHSAITWRQLLPLTKFQLYPTTSPVVPWALLMFGYLRMSKRRQHVVIKNILPSHYSWKPFG